MKPIIGITANISPAADERRAFAKGTALHYTPESYCRWVIAGGGVPLVLPILEDESLARELVQRLDGLLLTGGVDVDPGLYHETNSHSIGVQTQRDLFEIALLEAARREAKAALGICRGIQVLNVAFGGSLYQDVPTMIDGALQHHDWEGSKDAYHTALFTRTSPLSELFGREEITINSSHHQSIKVIGKGLEPLAASNDGVIEAVTCPSDRFTFGVQWHPERMPDDPKQVELAQWFISHAV